MEMEFFYAGCYTRSEKVIQPLKSFMLSLITGGFEYMKFYGRSQEPLIPPVEIGPDSSFLLLIPPEITLDFSAGEKRENWVAMLELPEVICEGNSLESSYRNVPLKPVVELNVHRMRTMREIFAAVVENISSGQPGSREKAKLQLGVMFAELMAASDARHLHSPGAEAMKKAIDEDRNFRYSVKELNDRIGFCSLPYMRKLFWEAYGILPGKYRSTQRLNRIMELFAQSDFSLKMIADEVGMKHLPHLYAFLRNEQSLSPGELLAQIRGQKHKG